MFCNRCGAQIEPDVKVCPKCGNPVGSAAGVSAPTDSGPVTPNPVTPGPIAPGFGAPARRTRLERHLRTVGILWIVAGVLWLIPSLALIGFSHAPRIFNMDDMLSHAFMPPMMLSLGALFFLVAIGGIFMGWGLMNHERWARITAIVLSILAILHPPFGTALGAYTLWVLLPADPAAEYDRLSR